MNSILKYALIIFLGGANIASSHGDKDSDEKVNKTVTEFLQNISKDNKKHVKSFDKAKNEVFAKKQTPRATVLMCSDSRVDGDTIDSDRINGHFVVRNIGNQIETAEGSIEYGIEHLHTPILLIVGHSGCGAIEAGRGDFSTLSAPIQKELKSLDVKDTKSLEDGIVHNVNHQVQIAQKTFEESVKRGELTIIGTVYDFRDDFKKGHGRLVLVNINGETDAAKLKDHPVLKGVKDMNIGVGK